RRVFFRYGVVLFGVTANQATRSINLFGVINFQPAEFVKLGVIIYLASIYSKKQNYIEDFKRAVFPPLLVVALLTLLILQQPDIGTSGIFISKILVMISCSGFKIKYLLEIAS